MKIRVGYELIYDLPQPTPVIMVLGTHFTRASWTAEAPIPTDGPPSRHRIDFALKSDD